MRTNAFLLILLMFGITACGGDTLVVTMEPGEKWWGAIDDPSNRRISPRTSFPFDEDSDFTLDLVYNNYSNNAVPFLVSNHGRYIWNDDPFVLTVKNGKLKCKSSSSPFDFNSESKTLKDAFLLASSRHFAPSGTMPPTEFFVSPQYNTWIELLYNQNQEDILEYASSIIEEGFPADAVLMVDDNWQKYYGNFEFKPDKFPDPAGMCRQLHEMGFKIMLWVCPYVSPDSPEYRELDEKQYLVLDKSGTAPAVVNWWNGRSAVLDMSNPSAVEWLVRHLCALQDKYGIDGFKFDAGDGEVYRDVTVCDGISYGTRHTRLWNTLATFFPYNEFRASWKMAGQASVMRLCDKSFSWEDVAKLIPSMIGAGLEGHIYTCPDMIGGGEYKSFLNLKEIDEELIVRSCQIHAMMPMMQFSVAPWRVLSPENCELCRQAALRHQSLAPYILEQAKLSSISGEPLVRAMDYVFPGEGFDNCIDQYMLGDRYLVAPMIARGTQREVTLPSGQWQDEQLRHYEGGRTYTIDVPLSRIPVFSLIGEPSSRANHLEHFE